MFYRPNRHDYFLTVVCLITALTFCEATHAQQTDPNAAERQKLREQLAPASKIVPPGDFDDQGVAYIHYDALGSYIQAIESSPYESLFAAGGADYVKVKGKVKPYSRGCTLFLYYRKARLTRRIYAHKDVITGIVFLPTEPKQVLTASLDGTLRFWSTVDQKMVRELKVGMPIISIAALQDGSRLLVGTREKEVQIWDLKRGVLTRRLEGHKSGYIRVAVSPQGYALTGSWQAKNGDYDLRLWHVKTGKLLRVFKGHTGRIWSLALSNYNRWALSGSADGTARLWDISTGKLIRILHRDEKGPPVRAIAFSPSDFQAVTLSGEDLRLWHVKSGTLVHKAKAAASQATAATFQSDEWAFFGGADQTIRYYEFITPTIAKGGYYQPSVSKIALLEGTVALHRPLEPAQVVPGTEQSILAREILRQAVLIAAREVLGLHTRDGVLRETIPEKATSRFTLATGVAGRSRLHFHIDLHKKLEDGAEEVVWRYELPVKGNENYDEIIATAESLARIYLPKALKDAGFPGDRRLKRSKEKIPPALSKDLSHMTMPTQFSAIRELHAAIREHGESPALLGGLVRAYSQLAWLTEHHWSTAHKVFKARALLYAERLVVMQPNSASGLWHRAFARAATGWHKKALEDLGAAGRQKRQEETRPTWVPAIEAFCRFQSKKLASLAIDSDTELISWLRFDAVRRNVGSQDLPSRTAVEVLRGNPENFAVRDNLSRISGVGVSHVTTVEGPKVFNATMPKRLLAMSELPPEVEQILKTEEGWEENESDIVAALRKTREQGDLSWSGLAALSQEQRFALVWRRLEFLKYSYSVPVEDYVKQTLPIVDDHPYRLFLQTYGATPSACPALMRKQLATIPITEINVKKQGRLLLAIQRYLPTRFQEALSLSVRHMDPIHNDYTDLLFAYQTDSGKLKTYANRLLQISPHSPAGLALLVQKDWNRAKGSAQLLEDSGHPVVLNALAKKYSKMKQWKDAERCLNKYLKVSNDHWPYLLLAKNYKAQKDMDKWLAILKKSLEQDFGLQNAKTRVTIARHYMANKEFKKAQPYAEEAAQSFAKWAMLCASECYEGLEDWQKSEQWIARVSRRYQSSYLTWFLWCKRTGHGDAAAAKKLVDDRFLGPGNQWKGSPYVLGLVLLLSEEEARAARVYEALYKKENDDGLALFAILLADASSQKKLRDELLAKLSKQNTFLCQLARQFESALKNGGKVDSKSVDAILKHMPARQRSLGNYVVGRFHHIHKQPKQARSYYDRALDLVTHEGLRTVIAWRSRQLEKK